MSKIFDFDTQFLNTTKEELSQDTTIPILKSRECGTMGQQIFNPARTSHFQWVEESPGKFWYSFDQEQSQKEARQQRDKLAKEMKSQGKTVMKSSSKGYAKMGGIGTPYPEIDLYVTWFHLTWRD